jgi:predicted phosphodiesterase
MNRFTAIVLHLACIARKLMAGRPIAFHIAGIKRAIFPENETIPDRTNHPRVSSEIQPDGIQDFGRKDVSGKSRGIIRHYRGANGRRHAAELKNKEFVISMRSPGEVLHRLPKGKKELKGWKPLQINGPCKALILSDVHVPFHDDSALIASVDAGKKSGCDVVILNGDFMDFYGASFFRKDPRTIDFAEEIRTGVQVLEWLRDQFPEARIIFKEGNHDERLEAYLIDKAPILLDLPAVSLPGLLHLAELGIEHVRDKRPIRLGKLNVLHGHEYRFIFSPVNAARGLFLRANAHAICGHLHKNSHHSEPNLEGRVISTWSVGCLCDLRPAYDPLAKWQHGAAIVRVEKGGVFFVDQIRIIDGKIY